MASGFLRIGIYLVEPSPGVLKEKGSDWTSFWCLSLREDEFAETLGLVEVEAVADVSPSAPMWM